METKAPTERKIHFDEYDAIEFRDTNDLLIVRNDIGKDPSPLLRRAIAITDSCYVQFKSDSKGSYCGMYVSREDLEILKKEPKIIVEHLGYFLTFTAHTILSIKTPSGKVITPLKNPIDAAGI